MAKVEDLANGIVLAKEQLMNINNTINRDRGVLEDLKKEIKQTEELKKLAQEKLDELTDQVTSAYANKDAVEKEYWAVRDNLKAEIKKLSESKKKDEEKYHISISELSNDVKILTARKEALEKGIKDLEAEAIKAKEKSLQEKWEAESSAKKAQDELNEINVKLAEQEWKFNTKEAEIKAMEDKLEDKAKLEKAISKAQKNLEEEIARINDAKEEKAEIDAKIKEAKSELKAIEKEKEKAAAEVADYVKKKIDIKERNDKLDAKEKALRKKFEEAWVKFD